MTSYALPCIVCDKVLERVGDDAPETQPYDGTNFSSHGHYGSTTFDPMDGSYISINICDDCLNTAGEKGQVVCGRSGRRVLCEVEVTEGRWMESDIGFEHINNGALVPWTKDLPSFDADDVCRLDLQDFEVGIPKNIEIRIDVDQLVADLRRRYESED